MFFRGFLLGALVASNLSYAESLFQEETFQPLYANHKAFKVGDSLTVLIVENALATSASDTSTEKKTDNSFTLGGTLTQPNKTPQDASLNGKINLNNDFTGGGKVQRSGKLLAQITATVVDISDNGELLLKGSQLIEVNSEKQQITIEGRVRPIDIAENNTVSSTRLANAHISYTGQGLLTDQQKPGFLSNLLKWIGL